MDAAPITGRRHPEAVAERTHADLVVRGAHGRGQGGRPEELAAHRKVRPRAARHASVDAREVDPVLVDHAVAERSAIGGLQVAVHRERCEPDAERTVRPRVHREAEGRHRALFMAVVHDHDIDHRDRAVARHGRRDGELTEIRDQVREARRHVELVQRRRFEARGAVGHVRIRHGFVRVAVDEVARGEHRSRSLSPDFDGEVAVGEVVVDRLEGGDAELETQQGARAAPNDHSSQERRLAALAVAAHPEVHRPHGDEAGPQVARGQVVEVLDPRLAADVGGEPRPGPAEGRVKTAHLDVAPFGLDGHGTPVRVPGVRQHVRVERRAAGHGHVTLRRRGDVGRRARIAVEAAAVAVARAIAQARLTADRPQAHAGAGFDAARRAGRGHGVHVRA